MAVLLVDWKVARTAGLLVGYLAGKWVAYLVYLMVVLSDCSLVVLKAAW